MAVKSKDEEDLVDLTRFSKVSSAVRVVARLLIVTKEKSFKGSQCSKVNPDLYKEAEQFLIANAQQSIDFSNLKRLNLSKEKNGIWVVGASRLAASNPKGTIHSDLPILLPTRNALTNLFMTEAKEVKTAHLLPFGADFGLEDQDLLAR